jgi:exodeoxyribonuclease V alpha subunit
MKSGVCGIENINKCLQDKINPSSLSKMEVETDKYIYRTGDRVMQVSNNYEREWRKDGIMGEGVFNGDIGVISDIDINTSEVIVEFEDGRIARYVKGDLEELTLSYAITIHKSQGSEFDVVIIPALSGPPMLLTRNLLYTAVTRAKKMVVIIGTKKCIGQMVHNNYTKVRYTMLKYFLELDGEKYENTRDDIPTNN